LNSVFFSEIAAAAEKKAEIKARRNQSIYFASTN